MKKLALFILTSALTTSGFAGQESGTGPKAKEMQLELTSAEMQHVLIGAFSGELLNIQKPGLENMRLKPRTFDFQSRTVELQTEDESLKVLAREAQ